MLPRPQDLSEAKQSQPFLTNFAGFLPTLLETSPQAQFLIPMTLSLSAGLLLGMVASLILTPVCYAALGRDR